MSATLEERRRAARISVLKSAKISVGVDGSHGVFNCLVLDKSETGVLVELEGFVILPEEVLLQMNSGAIYRARRCWAFGGKAGLAFIGGQLMTEEIMARMRKVGDVMRGAWRDGGGIHAALGPVFRPCRTAPHRRGGGSSVPAARGRVERAGIYLRR